MNQIQTSAETQSQQTSATNSKLFVFVAFSVLLTSVIVGSVVYFWQKSANEKRIINLEQKITSLEKQISKVKNGKSVSKPASSTISGPGSDWKTYRNTTHKFSFNYPPTLKVVSNSDFAVDLVEQNIEQKNIIPSNIKARISVNQISRNFDKIYSALNNTVILEEQHALDATFTKIKNHVIDGYKAVDYTYNVPGNQTSKNHTKGTIINKNGTLIEISSWDSKSIDIDQILSTFEFTN